MNPDHVAAHVRERSGLDVQAVTLVRSGTGDVAMPAVWAAMTELGHFWAVEDGQIIELFRAVAHRTKPTDLTACHSAVEAARRFLVLHPPARIAAVQRETVAAGAGLDSRPAEAGRPADADSGVCQACGVAYARRAQAGQVTAGGSSRLLCPRCRHAERERLRYQQDPTYRARRLAYSAARYRRGQQEERGDG